MVVLSRPQLRQNEPWLALGHSRAVCPWTQQLKQQPGGGSYRLSVGMIFTPDLIITPDVIGGYSGRLNIAPDPWAEGATTSAVSVGATLELGDLSDPMVAVGATDGAVSVSITGGAVVEVEASSAGLETVDVGAACLVEATFGSEVRAHGSS